MSDWIETEPAEGQMHDVRHTKRLARLLYMQRVVLHHFCRAST